MKHTSIVFSMCLVAFGLLSRAVFAGSINDMVLRFSTPGPDRYADGTIVPDGECYALVWAPTGKSFSGFNADGTAASPLDRVVLAGPLALGGRCRDSLFQIDASYANLVGGTWAVCLVDTRRANGIPAGVKDGKPVRVNRWGLFDGGVSIRPAAAGALGFAASGEPTRRAMGESSEKEEVPVSGGVRASKRSTVPAGTKSPRITGFMVTDGVATISVADTVPWLNYTIESSRRLGGSFSIDGLADVCDGDSASEIVLETESISPTRFFRVIRAE